jgi:hypothetical protein
MSTENDQDPIDIFRGLLGEGEDVGKDLADQGRARTQKGQELIDFSRSARKVLDSIPANHPVTGIEDAIEDWRFYITSARDERDNYSLSGLELLSSASGTANIYSSDLFNDVGKTIPQEFKPKFSDAAQEYNSLIDRAANRHEAVDLFRSLGLDKSFHGRRSALEQFEVAYDAMEKPVTGATDPAQTSLLPIREAIETALDHLLYLRPNRVNIGDVEGKNKDWRKIIAISADLKKGNIPDQIVQSWARDWSNLKDDLSYAKIDPLDRSEWARLLNKATLFVISFFSGLDPEKLRDGSA